MAVLDIPDITLTPRFAPAIAAQALVRTWISAYNTRLNQNFSGDARVAIVPFYADFQDEIAHPGNYSLSNVVDQACTTDHGAPLNYFPCTAAELDAIPNKTVGWWQRYAFSDGFHPTPYGHQLLAASVARTLARKGWL